MADAARRRVDLGAVRRACRVDHPREVARELQRRVDLRRARRPRVRDREHHRGDRDVALHGQPLVEPVLGVARRRGVDVVVLPGRSVPPLVAARKRRVALDVRLEVGLHDRGRVVRESVEALAGALVALAALHRVLLDAAPADDRPRVACERVCRAVLVRRGAGRDERRRNLPVVWS